MGKKMTHAPVYFTIVQVRFNPITALDDYAPKIQDRLRRSEFPDFQKDMVATFNLNLGNTASTQVPVAQTARYKFSNMEKTAGFNLDQSSLSFQTTHYDVFESFSKTFMSGLEIVNDVVALSYVDRIGVRYLDAVFPNEGEEISKYLNESVLGLSGKLKGNLIHSYSETFIKIDNINIVARTMIQSGGIGFPPDLHPVWLTLSKSFQTLQGFHAILDTDGSDDSRKLFDMNDIAKRLKTVHSAVTSSFKATVTKHALDRWE